MTNTVQASIKVTVNDMFFFMMQHTYRSFSGVCSLIFSFGALVIFFVTWGKVDISYTILLAVCSALFTIINPLMLYTRSAKQVALNPVMKTPIEYTFGEQCFLMKQGQGEAKADYKELYKIKNTKNYLYLYGTPTRANIISKKQLGEQEKVVTEMILKAMKESGEKKEV